MRRLCPTKTIALSCCAIVLTAVFFGFTEQPPAAPAHYVGEKFGGGIVFYVSDEGKHGLIAATTNQSEGVEWYNGKFKATGTPEGEMNQGIKNTDAIISVQKADNPNGKFAAKLCADYSVTVDGQTYDDWYLPSKYELNLLFQKHEKVGGFDERYFWSSNEVDSLEAWLQSFYDGRQLNVSKSDQNYVRAIRAF